MKKKAVFLLSNIYFLKVEIFTQKSRQNINDLVNNTKVNIDVDDNNKLYQVLLLSEIFLIFLMIVIFVLFIIYLYEKYQKYKEGFKKPYKRVSSNLDTFLQND